MKKYLLIALLIPFIPRTFAKTAETLNNPEQGVLCDRFFCADQNGVSPGLTLKYLGIKRKAALSREGGFDKTAFTFSNGLFCDTTERLCHIDRYYDENGKRSPVDRKGTDLLFQK